MKKNATRLITAFLFLLPMALLMASCDKTPKSEATSSLLSGSNGEVDCSKYHNDKATCNSQIDKCEHYTFRGGPDNGQGKCLKTQAIKQKCEKIPFEYCLLENYANKICEISKTDQNKCVEITSIYVTVDAVFNLAAQLPNSPNLIGALTEFNTAFGQLSEGNKKLVVEKKSPTDQSSIFHLLAKIPADQTALTIMTELAKVPGVDVALQMKSIDSAGKTPLELLTTPGRTGAKLAEAVDLYVNQGANLNQLATDNVVPYLTIVNASADTTKLQDFYGKMNPSQAHKKAFFTYAFDSSSTQAKAAVKHIYGAGGGMDVINTFLTVVYDEDMAGTGTKNKLAQVITEFNLWFDDSKLTDPSFNFGLGISNKLPVALANKLANGAQLDQPKINYLSKVVDAMKPKVPHWETTYADLAVINAIKATVGNIELTAKAILGLSKDINFKLVELTFIPTIEAGVLNVNGIASMNQHDSLEELLDKKVFSNVFTENIKNLSSSFQQLENLSIPKIYKDAFNGDLFKSNVKLIYLFPAYRNQAFKSFDIAADTIDPINFEHYHRWWSSADEQKQLWATKAFQPQQLYGPQDENFQLWVSNGNTNPMTGDIHLIFINLMGKPKSDIIDIGHHVFDTIIKPYYHIEAYVRN